MKTRSLSALMMLCFFAAGCSNQKTAAFNVPAVDGFEFGKITIQHTGYNSNILEALVDIKNVTGRKVKISFVKAHVMNKNGAVLATFGGNVYAEVNNNETFRPINFVSENDEEKYISLTDIKSVKLFVIEDSSKAAAE